ncbi:MAG: ABC transporter ATP-binding protein [Candidatus Omnitrophota bacterium]|jgi:ABC-2 type transport system ATP-binding protein
MNDHVIQVEHITKRYKAKPVLNDLSLMVPRGSVFGLLGKNGAGKTTLLKCVLGLVYPQGGQISVLDDNPKNFLEHTKERIGYVPQSDRPYPWLTVRQLVIYTASFYPLWNMPLVDKLLQDWELDEDEKVGLLSEGQAQKLSIILALGHEPELLIFDEPVASLDPAARRKFLKTILDIVANRECTIFFSTHITTDLERVADRVALLKNGTIDFCGELDVLKDEVKRLRILSSVPLSRDILMEGVLHCELSQYEAVLSVRGFNAGIKSQMEQRLNARIEVEDLNLEEIFLELHE